MEVLQGRIDVVVVRAKGLLNLDSNFLSFDKSDPYCVVDIEEASGTTRIGKTKVINNNLNPKWNCSLMTILHKEVSCLKFTVKDKDAVSSQVIGTCSIPVNEFVNGQELELTLELNTEQGKPAGKLMVKIMYTSSASLNIENGCIKETRESTLYATPKAPGTFLHGTLDIFIEKAGPLPKLDGPIFSLTKKNVTCPYVTISLEDGDSNIWKLATTKIIDSNINPVWNESLKVDVCHYATSVIVTVKHNDFVVSKPIGSVVLNAKSIIDGNIPEVFQLVLENDKNTDATINLKIQLTEKQNALESNEVPNCSYGMKSNNLVRLYQDAHCPTLPLLFPNKEGNEYEPRSAWRDLYHTIINAQKLICIVGWSVSAKIQLLRWEGEDHRTLGELLKERANNGVCIKIMLWDELTSNDLNKTGVMSTEDEQTKKFFKGTGIIVKLVTRDCKSNRLISAKGPFTKFCYSHHQKFVIADIETPGSSERHLVTYIGGLDLTSGRFDTPEHPLFNTLNADHKNDFYNNVNSATVASGPRQPWHDIHARVEGPAAIDILHNFQERWSKQGEQGEPIINLLAQESNVSIDFEYNDTDAWNVQMLRSINSDSAIFSSDKYFSCKKGRLFDDSLHKAYIHNIRRSQKFIYIENQYFLGSSHLWLDCKDANASNLVPLELCVRIEEKIRANERFVVYITIPMFPEGQPADKVIQEILHWQYRTIQMMYMRIGAAIRDVGIDAHPQDYLVILCLGKKESSEQVPPELTPPVDCDAAKAFEHKRLMIYVHSKMAIFDDEYIIVGSANINDRSLSGNRDTEIAIGAYQPNYATAQQQQLPYGDVALFRRALWSEHMGTDAPIDCDPSSLECATRVRELGEEALQIYKDDSPDTPCPRHMLIYPLQVNKEGIIRDRLDCRVFPDTQAPIIGARSNLCPSNVTT